MLDSKADDLKLPNAVVARIIKRAVPDGTKVTKEAQIAIARAAAVFLLNVANNANDYGAAHKHKQLGVEEVAHALRALEFDTLVPKVDDALTRWRHTNEIRKRKNQERRAERKRAAAVAAQEATTVATEKSGEGDEAAEEAATTADHPSQDDFVEEE